MALKIQPELLCWKLSKRSVLPGKKGWNEKDEKESGGGKEEKKGENTLSKTSKHRNDPPIATLFRRKLRFNDCLLLGEKIKRSPPMPFEFRIPRTVPRFHLLFTLFSSIYSVYRVIRNSWYEFMPCRHSMASSIPRNENRESKHLVNFRPFEFFSEKDEHGIKFYSILLLSLFFYRITANWQSDPTNSIHIRKLEERRSKGKKHFYP